MEPKIQNVLVYGGNSIAAEVIRSLLVVNQGLVRSITVFDGSLVKVQDIDDVGVRREDVGMSRAESLCKNLRNKECSVCLHAHVQKSSDLDHSFLHFFDVIFFLLLRDQNFCLMNEQVLTCFCYSL